MPIDQLTPARRNAKAHDLAAMGASVAAFGMIEPLVLDERTGRLLAGHGRLDYLLGLSRSGALPPPGVEVGPGGGWQWLVARGWSSTDDAHADGAATALNRVGELGGWDAQVLADVLADAADYDWCDALGWSTAELDDLLAEQSPPPPPVALVGPEEVPPAPASPVSRPGDLWLCGPHRALVGDATDAAAWDLVLGGAQADLCLTDPPYGVGVDFGPASADDPEHVAGLVAAFMPLALERSRCALVTSGQPCMWDYPRPAWVMGLFWPAAEGKGPWGFTNLTPVLAYGPDPYLAAGLGCRPSGWTWNAKPASAPGHDHPTAKPLAPWSWLMERGTTTPGAIVVDPFGGSGTTMVVAHLLGRHARLVEISPAFVDVTCRRWQSLTGQLPVLERTGRPHDFCAGPPVPGRPAAGD